jgi:hypothetical protein
MKTTLFVVNTLKKFSVITLLAMFAVLSACSLHAQGKKKLLGKRVKEPFSDVRSDKKFFRVVANSESPRNDIAKQRSETAAKAKLGGLISTTVKQVTDQYVEQLSVANKTEVNEKYQAMTRTVTNQTLTGIVIKDQECLYKKKEEMWNCYTVIELSKEEFQEAQDKAISKDDKLKLSYDRKKYEETFDKEMDKLEKSEAAKGDE